MEETKPLRILMVEDSDDDAQLELRALRLAGYNPSYERVDTATGLKAALQKKWDIVISDYHMPNLTTEEILATVKQHDIDLPIIIISGAIGEDTAVQTMRSGACDYIMKDNLKRLDGAVTREVREANRRKSLRQAELRAAKRSLVQYEVMGVLTQSLSLPDTITNILRIVGDTLEWKMGVFWIKPEPSSDLELFQTWRSTVETGRLELSEELINAFTNKQGLLSEILEKGQARWFSKLTHSPEATFQSALGFPILNGKNIMGIMAFFATDEREPDEDQLQMAMTMGGQVGQYMTRLDAEEALRATEARYVDLYENAPDMFASIAAGSHFLIQCNRTFSETLGYTKDEILNRPIFDLIHENCLAVAYATFQASFQNDRVHTAELQFKHKDGRAIDLSLRTSIVRDDRGKPTHNRSVLRDMTEWKRIEEKLRKAVELRDEFLSIASHELRTPLTSLYLQLQMLEKAVKNLKAPLTMLPEAIAKKIALSTRQAKQLGDLIDSLLDVSRIERNEMTLNKEELDLAKLVQEVAQRFSEEAKRAGGELSFRSESNAVGRWDALRMTQAITNIISNAIKYGAGKPINIQVSVAKDVASIKVRDQGIGIASADQKRIFSRFERAISHHHISGFGLGLYITRHIVHTHGGRIYLESELEKGTVVTVELPLKEGLILNRLENS